jgi:N-acyl-D-amino-acid deacylase
MADYDLVIRGGEVFDGSGGPGRAGDVAISSGRVAAVGQVAGLGVPSVASPAS